MSQSKVNLLTHIIRDTYGPRAEQIAHVLLLRGSVNLTKVKTETGLSIVKVKNIMWKFNQHHLLTFRQRSSRHPPEYSLNEGAVLNLLRMSKFIHIAKTLFGDESELLVEELLFKGHLCLSVAVRNVTQRLLEALEGEDAEITPEDVKVHFTKLVSTHFVRRVSEVEDMSAHVPSFIDPPDPYQLPALTNVGGSSTGNPEQDEEPAAKKRKVDEPSTSAVPLPPDSEILWECNNEKFLSYLRDQLVLQWAAIRHDSTTIDVLRAVLRTNELKSDPGCAVSNPLNAQDIHRLVPPNLEMSKTTLDQHLELLVNDGTRLVSRVSDSAGGTYQIDYIQATRNLAESRLGSIIKENFGVNGHRIFNLLLEKKYLEQNELETFALLPSKEGKEVTYNMLAQGYIMVKDIPRSADFAPSRSLYLFHVNLPRVAHRELQRCYKALHNLIDRRQHETKERKALLNTVQKVEALIAQIQDEPGLDEETKEAQVKEVEEGYLPASVKQAVEEHKKRMSKLMHGELHLDSTIFILESYLALSGC